MEHRVKCLGCYIQYIQWLSSRAWNLLFVSFFFFGQMKRYKSYLDYSVIIKARWKRSDSFCEQNKYNSQHTVAADAYILHIEFKRWVMSLLKEEHLSQEWLKSG